MTAVTLLDLQASVQDKAAFKALADYAKLCNTFLELIRIIQPVRIVSPTHNNYIFYQYDATYGYKITRPLNINLFIESANAFSVAFERFFTFLSDLRRYQDTVTQQGSTASYIKSNELNKVIYTIQQAIGSVGDSFENPNQSRKRVGQLFETLVKLIIQQVGLECEPRTIKIPIPGYPGYEMSYELDLVFSRNKAIIAAETQYIHLTEIVGSVKTTSKDRIDKIFLDKYRNFSISQGAPSGTAACCRMISGRGGIACVRDVRSVRYRQKEIPSFRQLRFKLIKVSRQRRPR